jgi:hypothetical protein
MLPSFRLRCGDGTAGRRASCAGRRTGPGRPRSRSKARRVRPGLVRLRLVRLRLVRLRLARRRLARPCPRVQRRRWAGRRPGSGRPQSMVQARSAGPALSTLVVLGIVRPLSNGPGRAGTLAMSGRRTGTDRPPGSLPGRRADPRVRGVRRTGPCVRAGPSLTGGRRTTRVGHRTRGGLTTGVGLMTAVGRA